MSEGKRSWFGVIFGLVFFCAGAAAFYVTALGPSLGVLGSLDWVSTPAQMINIDLKDKRGSDSTTYLVEGTYTYQYRGVSYTSSQISFSKQSDNIGSYWQDLYQRLANDRSRGNVQAWVNPENPSEAVLDRTIRWPAIAFGSFFAFAFCGIGGFFAWRSWRKSSSAPEQQRLNSSTGINSKEKHSGYIVLAFGSLFFVVGATMSALILPEELANENYAALAVLLFLFAGAGIMVSAFKAILSYNRVGATPLFLSPTSPGVGGEFGASFILPSRAMANSSSLSANLTATLSCIRSYRSGKNTSYSTLWSQSLPAHTELSANGLEVVSRFDIPEGLKATREWHNKSSIDWELNVEGSIGANETNSINSHGHAQEFARSWAVIVSDQPSAEKSAFSIPQTVLEQAKATAQQKALESALSQITLKDEGYQVEIFSAAGRHLFGGILGMLVGAMFGGIGFILSDESWIGYALIGLGSIVGLTSLYSLGSSLRSTFDRQTREVIVSHKWMGIPTSTARHHYSDLNQLTVKRTSSTQNGRKTTQYFALNLKQGKDRIRLAQGIEGKEAANALKAELAKRLD